MGYSQRVDLNRDHVKIFSCVFHFAEIVITEIKGDFTADCPFAREKKKAIEEREARGVTRSVRPQIFKRAAHPLKRSCSFCENEKLRRITGACRTADEIIMAGVITSHPINGARPVANRQRLTSDDNTADVILLGPVHAAAAGGEPHHPAGGHFLLQRRPQHALDRLQLFIRHDISYRYSG
ncbi:hypothetical protein EVAR_77231_1 [Eumeta japonica]|uniref:Uncharacterized protein n=1 Tax=Eumeta variegata TaxID=151549 RepID=A0A4C1T530_EUMVA|nr:hypothetical protein EVAR_77231_1 [Eumeta japonica]